MHFYTTNSTSQKQIIEPTKEKKKETPFYGKDDYVQVVLHCFDEVEVC